MITIEMRGPYPMVPATTQSSRRPPRHPTRFESVDNVYFSSMSVIVEPILEKLASGQWGLFTAAQARARGVSRANLSHRERDGRLERLAHGVYRLGGVPVAPLDDLHAAWMSTVPELLAWERLENPRVVIGGAAAAAVHEAGDIEPAPYRMITSERRQTQRPDIAYSRRQLEPRDVVVIAGLPVTSIERTVADLVDEVGDLSLVGDVLADATRGERAVDLDHLSLLLAPYATKYGHPRRDGTALLEQIRRSAGIDDVAAARALIQRPAVGAALEQVITREVAEQLRVIAERLQFKLQGSTQFSEQLEQMIAPMIQAQSRLASEIADAVLSPFLEHHREQMEQISSGIAAQMSGIRMPKISVPARTFRGAVNPTVTIPAVPTSGVSAPKRPGVSEAHADGAPSSAEEQIDGN
ncbi:hypothetical protein E3O42_10250 [Cryobacterium adonitolivorans]|uniref:AbiEi antitoxin N-terminal domain-containing protein n=2 Tax=Cryobacterium adonitolivorans TaxID=1259189 RepID=A0A4R8W5Y9_9MICO|nr:hypothetical protein E3O42_10250 [Cryobacterium adonitolivorans]